MSKLAIVTALLLSLMAIASAWEDKDFFRNCSPSQCSDGGPKIRFPHRLESSNTSSACGASCAKLTCSGEDTILLHPFLGPCKVTAIGYKEASMSIIPLVDSLSPCPLQKLTFHSLPDFARRICALYNTQPGRIIRCSKVFTQSGASPDSENDYTDSVVGPISCLSDPSHFSYLVSEWLYLSVLPLDCRVVSKVRIPWDFRSGMFKQSADRIINFSETTTRWDLEGTITDNCKDCEKQGRHCAFSSQKNQTFCMCHGPNVKVIAATSSVAVFVVLSLMVATMLYLSLKV